MAPTKKKSVNKRLPREISPDKEVRNSNKKRERKTGRKHSNKLGPEWSKMEIQLFYKAYREYGTDWKKVAAELSNRTSEMVEALYSMNQAFLSLPEGVATVLGLTAMMTDYYSVRMENIQGTTDSEPEANGVLEVSPKSQKRKRAKVQFHLPKEDLMQSKSTASPGGCLSLLQRGSIDGGKPRAVGKRTPRFPVSYKKDDRGNISCSRKGGKLETDGDGDDDVARAAVLALTEASQGGDSPQSSQTPPRRSEKIKSSPVQSRDRLFLPAKSPPLKLRDSIDDRRLEGGVRTKGVGNRAYSRYTKSLADVEGVGTITVHRKGKKSYGKKVEVKDTVNIQSDDDGWEACSGTEGQKAKTMKGKVPMEVSSAKSEATSPQFRKRIKKSVSGEYKHWTKYSNEDELSALVALQRLAHVSAMESESSGQLNEERSTHNVDDNSSLPETISNDCLKARARKLGQKANIHLVENGADARSSKRSKIEKLPGKVKTVSEIKQKPQANSNGALKQKQQHLESKISEAEAPTDSHLSKPLGTEAIDEQECISMFRGDHTGQTFAPSEELKSSNVLEDSSLSGDWKTADDDQAVSSVQGPVASRVISQVGRNTRSKMELKKTFLVKERKSSENTVKGVSEQDGTVYLKEKLSSCLSSSNVRRWCTFEWFYNSIDYPWFAKREFEEYLNHVGLGDIPRLTLVEWGVVRSSLGKPRRFSRHFLQEERTKLEQYRKAVRKHYTELRTGIRDGLPTDLGRPLSVGQRVIAIHPKTRELHDGAILTVDHDRCQIQFDCPELGVAQVKDLDCMPVNPLENIPDTLRRQRFSLIPNELTMVGQSNIAEFFSNPYLPSALSPIDKFGKKGQVDLQHGTLHSKVTESISQPQTVGHTEAKQVNIQALSELNHALDKKVCSPFLGLTQKNTYLGNSLPPWLQPPLNSSIPGDVASAHGGTSLPQDSESTVVEVVRCSRTEAHTMVDAAVQAFSSIKEGDDVFGRLGEAIESVHRKQFPSESSAQVMRSLEQINGDLHDKDITTNVSVSGINGNAPETINSNGATEKGDAALLSELITSCVATLHMIQTCTERQYPPADVAQIIDSAVTSLHPKCPQNLPIYREIQMCMGILKTQILALVPT